jgi:hypothetical protein
MAALTRECLSNRNCVSKSGVRQDPSAAEHRRAIGSVNAVRLMG